MSRVPSFMDNIHTWEAPRVSWNLALTIKEYYNVNIDVTEKSPKLVLVTTRDILSDTQKTALDAYFKGMRDARVDCP